jgi:hypothetical protein
LHALHHFSFGAFSQRRGILDPAGRPGRPFGMRRFLNTGFSYKSHAFSIDKKKSLDPKQILGKIRKAGERIIPMVCTPPL